MTSPRLLRLTILRLPRGVVAVALVSRLFDEWWSWLPAGSIDGLRDDLSLSYGQIGWILGMLWGGGLAGGPLGALADHRPRRPLAVSGVLLLALGLLPFALGAPFAVLVSASFVLGAASDLALQPVESSLAEVAGDRLERLLGRQHLITWVGDLAAPALLAIGAATALGWRGAFAVTSAVLIVYAAVLAVTEFPPPPRPAGNRRLARQEVLATARRGDTLLLAAASFVLGPLDEPLLGYAVARLAGGGDGASSQLLAVGVFAGGVAGAAIVSAIGMRPMVRRAGPVLLVLGAAAAALADRLWTGIAAFVIIGLGMEATWTLLHARTLRLVEGRAGTVGLVLNWMTAPSLLVPVAIGALADSTSLTVGLWAYAVLAAPLLILLPAINRATDDRRAE